LFAFDRAPRGLGCSDQVSKRDQQQAFGCHSGSQSQNTLVSAAWRIKLWVTGWPVVTSPPKVSDGNVNISTATETSMVPSQRRAEAEPELFSFCCRASPRLQGRPAPALIMPLFPRRTVVGAGKSCLRAITRYRPPPLFDPCSRCKPGSATPVSPGENAAQPRQSPGVPVQSCSGLWLLSRGCVGDRPRLVVHPFSVKQSPVSSRVSCLAQLTHPGNRIQPS